MLGELPGWPPPSKALLSRLALAGAWVVFCARSISTNGGTSSSSSSGGSSSCAPPARPARSPLARALPVCVCVCVRSAQRERHLLVPARPGGRLAGLPPPCPPERLRGLRRLRGRPAAAVPLPLASPPGSESRVSARGRD
ncbi:hypothetical protein LEMLEM_LOCUS1223 [Lemmus lemmus]